ncbi:unnamed protein product, partial [Oppiella nova]
SDVYHAYQIVGSHGIPDNQIIVFHFDDIADHKLNPTLGVVINRPNGTDVYHGVPKDYVGADVNPKTFLKVLSGDQELANAGRKVLKSGPDDHVFIFFDDHGSMFDKLLPKDINIYATTASLPTENSYQWDLDST